MHKVRHLFELSHLLAKVVLMSSIEPEVKIRHCDMIHFINSLVFLKLGLYYEPVLFSHKVLLEHSF